MLFVCLDVYFQAGMPFAVVGSNTLIEVCGKKVRGRLYPWGVVEGKACFTDICTMLLCGPEKYKINA